MSGSGPSGMSSARRKSTSSARDMSEHARLSRGDTSQKKWFMTLGPQ